MSPKVLVTGASGLLGRAIMRIFREAGWETVGLAYSRVGPGLVKCDLTKPEEVKSLIEKEKPEFIVHAAAERAPDAVENRYDEVCKLNVNASGQLAALAKSVGARMIYVSTDYVFDGTSPPYKSTDPTNPLNKYGITKLEGEKAVVAANPRACILRIPILYGKVETIDESAVTCLLKLVKSPEEKQVSHYERRYPCLVDDIARILRDLVLQIMKDDSITGIFQWSGKQRLTKYDMAVAMAHAFSLKHNIKPDPNPVPGAQRPFDAELDRSRLENLGISHHMDFETAIKECLSEWV
ncbi:methionine adenosyltransferase 2 subunit beta-like [Macrobrachium rosenbergii]|uniref:methionine adenosyltransferase 2 subunit beta-like n=1 Tax=Macrobrachium rosenbergii TaxID=79674 RepID=UPI0034D4C953